MAQDYNPSCFYDQDDPGTYIKYSSTYMLYRQDVSMYVESRESMEHSINKLRAAGEELWMFLSYEWKYCSRSSIPA